MNDDDEITLEQQVITQEATIDRLNHQLAVISKRDEHAQAYIVKLQKRVADLEAQVTDEARAEWIFRN